MSHLPPSPPFYAGDRFDLPPWAEQTGAHFALEGRLWRIVGRGSHNNTPWRNGAHPSRGPMPMVDFVYAVPASEPEAPALPAAPCTQGELQSALVAFCSNRRFHPDELARALHLHTEGLSR